MSDQNDQDNLLDFEAFQLDEFNEQEGDYLNSNNPSSGQIIQEEGIDQKDRRVKVEFTEEVIRFNPRDAIASGNVVITNESKGDSSKGNQQTNGIHSLLPLSKDDNGEMVFKKSQKVKKLQTEYRDYIETEQALKEFQDKEYQFRFIIDNFIQLNNVKQQQLEQQKQCLFKLQNNRYVPFEKSDPLLHVNNNNNLRVFANQKINKYDEYYPEEIDDILGGLKERIQKKVDRVKEEQFYTKTLLHMEQRLILQKEEVQKLQLEYEELNVAVEKNITYLEDDEKETKAQNVLNVCKQQYVKKAMNHIEEIHKTVMQKTMYLQEVAETDLKYEIDQYKDIKESLVEAKEILKETQSEIEFLEHQHMNKLRQQQELDSLIDHLSDFNMLAQVFIYDDPSKHFTSQLAFCPNIDFSELEEDEIITEDQKNKSLTPCSSTSNNLTFDEKKDSHNVSTNLAGTFKYTQRILKQKNLMLYALKICKKLTQIKNDLDSDEAKAQFIVTILNQFYEAHKNDIPKLFEELETNYIYACKLSDHLSVKVIQLEVDKKKYQEELNELSTEAGEIRKKFQKKKKNIEINEIDTELDQYSYNQIVSNHFSNDKFLEEFYSSETEAPNFDIYQMLKQNEVPQQSSFLEEKEDFNKSYNTFLNASNIMLTKFFSLLNQIRDRGDAQNQELIDLIDESLMFLRGWKVQSKELDSNSRYLIIQEMKQLDMKYILDNILTERNLLDCLTVDVGGADCLFGVLKIFDRIFKDRYTLKSICDKVIREQQSMTTDEYEKDKIKQNIENVFNQSKELNVKRCKEFFLEILESHCFIWKYATKGQLAKYMCDVKQQYDMDLEEYLSNNQDFKEGNQKINIDENHIIRLFLQRWNWLFEKACNRAMEWIYDIMSLFKKVLMIVLRRKMILGKQLGLVDWYDEEGVLHRWYDPVSAFDSKKFDYKLNNMLAQIHNQKSSQISMYLGKHYESTADTFQCVSLDTQIPIRTNQKTNIFSIVKEHVEHMEQGEEFINIKDDLIQFEKDRKDIKKVVDLLYRPSSANKTVDGDDGYTPTSQGISNINSNETGSKKQRPFSATRGEENIGTRTMDLSVSGQIQQSNINEGGVSAIQGNSDRPRSRNGAENSILAQTIKKKESIIQNVRGKKREGGGVSSAGEETAASMNDLPSGEYHKKLGKNKNELSEKKLGLLIDFGQAGSNSVKKKILQELTKEIKTVDKEELKQLIQSERNNIVHQQSEYRKVRDQYIKDKQFDDYHNKLSAEIQKQILFLQQQLSQTNQVSPQMIQQMNTQMQQLQSQFQRIQIGGMKSVPAQFKKKQQSAIQVLQQQQTQLQQLQMSATQGASQGFLSGTTSSNANTVQNQQNILNLGNANNTDKKAKKKKKVFLDVMKDKWERKEVLKLKMQQKGFIFGGENSKEKDDQNSVLNNTSNSAGSPVARNKQNTNYQSQNSLLLPPNKFETTILKIVDNDIKSTRKSMVDSGLNQQQIQRLKRDNLFLQHLERESLQQQFIKLNQQLTIQERFNKLHTNISSPDAHNSTFQPDLLFRNSVKTIKIINKFKAQNPQEEDQNSKPKENIFSSLTPISYSQKSPSNQHSKLNKGFQIRSLSPNQQQHAKTGIGFYKYDQKNNNKFGHQSKSQNRSLNRLTTPSRPSSQQNKSRQKDRQAIESGQESTPNQIQSDQKEQNNKYSFDIRTKDVSFNPRMNIKRRGGKSSQVLDLSSPMISPSNPNKNQSPLSSPQQRNAKSSERKHRKSSKKDVSSDSSSSSIGLNTQRKLLKDLNKYFKQNDYF